jgi:hypothetical protein
LTAEEIVSIAMDASDAARRSLRERGREPDAYASLVLALEEGVAELLATQNQISEWDPLPDERAWRSYVEQVRERLESDPPERWPPEPPRRSPPALVVDLIAGRSRRERPDAA